LQCDRQRGQQERGQREDQEDGAESEVERALEEALGPSERRCERDIIRDVDYRSLSPPRRPQPRRCTYQAHRPHRAPPPLNYLLRGSSTESSHYWHSKPYIQQSHANFLLGDRVEFSSAHHTEWRTRLD